MDEIVLDTRESNGKFISYLYDSAKEKGYEVKVKALEVGDVQCGNIVIEIKRINDFAGSVCGDHMWNQLYSMKANPEASCLVMISGKYDKLWKDNISKIPMMEGAIVRIRANGIPVIKFDNDEELVDYMLKLFEHSSPLEEPIKRVEKNKKTSIFMALPHIGRKACKKLIKEFDTIESLCLASKKEICEVLGEKRGNDVYDALRK